MKLHICGVRGSFPAFGNEYRVFGHDTSCYAFVEDDYALILDCGSGFIGACDLVKNCSKIDVFLSHLHYDHIMGLFETADFIKGKDIRFYGNFKLWEEAEKENKNGAMCTIKELIPENRIDFKFGQEISLPCGYSVKSIRSVHPDSTSMFIVRNGSKIVVYTADYEHNDHTRIEKIVKDCDLLLIDGTYEEDEYALRTGWGHSKWTDAINIALANDVKRVVITHHASTHDDSLLGRDEEKAKSMFSGASFAKQGEVYYI